MRHIKLFEQFVNEGKAGADIKPGEYIKSEYGYFYQRVDGMVGGQPAFVYVEADKKGGLKIGKKKTSIHSSSGYEKVTIEEIKTSLNILENLVNEGMLDMMVAVRDLARKMAKDYAKEASQFVLDGAVINDPERDAEMSLSKMSKELQINEGLKDTIKKWAKKTNTVSLYGSILTGLGTVGAYLNYLDNKFYEWYYKTIKGMADYEILGLLQSKHDLQADISTWEKTILMYAFFVFFTIFVVSYATKKMTK